MQRAWLNKNPARFIGSGGRQSHGYGEAMRFQSAVTNPIYQEQLDDVDNSYSKACVCREQGRPIEHIIHSTFREVNMITEEIQHNSKNNWRGTQIYKHNSKASAGLSGSRFSPLALDLAK